MPSHQPNKKTLVRKILLSIGIIGCLCLIADLLLPFFTSFIALNEKCDALKKQSTGIHKKLSKIDEEGITTKKDYSDGDCLTAGGNSFKWISKKHYSSPMEAKNDAFNTLSSVGIATPTIDQKPERISSESDDKGYYNIKFVELTYSKKNKNRSNDNYVFSFKLDSTINCISKNNGPLLCNGVDKDLVIERLLNTQPIKYTELLVTIDLP